MLCSRIGMSKGSFVHVFHIYRLEQFAVDIILIVGVMSNGHFGKGLVKELASLNIINCQFGHVQGSAILPVYIV